jgi:outer membrane protein assembly factor BamA
MSFSKLQHLHSPKRFPHKIVFTSRHYITITFIIIIFHGLTLRTNGQEIKLNDTLILRRPKLTAYPFIFYTPETKLALGAGGIFVFYADSTRELHPSKVTFSGYYSTNKQYQVKFTPQFYFFKNKLFISLPITYGYYISKFFGIGDQQLEEGHEVYTSAVFNASIMVQAPALLFSSDRTGFLFDINYTEILDKKNNELLLGVGYDGVWDNRDNIFYPTRGSYQYFKITLYPYMGDYAFYSFELDVRKYFHLAARSTLAYNFYYASTGGETPFYKLPAMGGQNRMRGYYEGEFRNNSYSTMQFEFRQFVLNRIGFVLFAGVGQVANSIIEYDFKDFRICYGGGLRYIFNKSEKINLRFDAGFGKDTYGLYVGMEEAF